MGIEPTLAAWEAAVLPLNYTRFYAPERCYSITASLTNGRDWVVFEGGR